MERILKTKVKQLFFESVPRYYEHTLSVVKNMKKLIKNIKKSRDRTILLAACYLHDIGYSTFYKNHFVGNIQNQKIKIKVHSELGAKTAKKILTEMHVEKEIIQKVVWLVSVHHRDDIKDRHLKLLLKADKGCLCGK